METERYAPTFAAKDITAWRSWLDQHGRTEQVIYLIVYHKTSKIESIHWHEAIEHALCYGWVDSVAHTRDAQSCYLKFTPRKPTSTWGRKNVERANKMIALGLMTPAGYELINRARRLGKWPQAAAESEER